MLRTYGAADRHPTTSARLSRIPIQRSQHTLTAPQTPHPSGHTQIPKRERNPNTSHASLQSIQICVGCLFSHVLRSLCPESGRPSWSDPRVQIWGQINCLCMLVCVRSWKLLPFFHTAACDLGRLASSDRLTIAARLSGSASPLWRTFAAGTNTFHKGKL